MIDDNDLKEAQGAFAEDEEETPFDPEYEEMLEDMYKQILKEKLDRKGFLCPFI